MRLMIWLGSVRSYPQQLVTSKSLFLDKAWYLTIIIHWARALLRTDRSKIWWRVEEESDEPEVHFTELGVEYSSSFFRQCREKLGRPLHSD